MVAVSVVIPHFNDLKNLQFCLRCLTQQTLPKEEYEIIVADNNSTCGVAAVVNLCGSNAKVITASIQGAAAARNAGVAVSRGSVLAFIDSDCRAEREWLAEGVAALAKADMAGGQVAVLVENSKRLTAVEAFECVFAFDFRRYIEEEGFAGAGNMFIPRRIFDVVGDFRSGVSEDKDWGQRAVGKGFKWIYVPSAKVLHPARRDWSSLRNKWRRIVRESYLLEKEKSGGKIRWLLRAWAVLASPVIHVGRVLSSRKLSRFEDKIKAIIVLICIRTWRFVESHRVLWRH